MDKKNRKGTSRPEAKNTSEDQSQLSGNRHLASEFIRVLRVTGYPEQFLPSIETILPLTIDAPEFMRLISTITSANAIHHELPYLESEPELANPVNEEEECEILGQPSERLQFVSSNQDVIDSKECLEIAESRSKCNQALMNIIKNRSLKSEDKERKMQALLPVLKQALNKKKSECKLACAEAVASVAPLRASLAAATEFIDNSLHTQPPVPSDYLEKEREFIALYEEFIKDISNFLQSFKTLNLKALVHASLRYKQICLKRALIKSGKVNEFIDLLKKAKSSDSASREELKGQIQDFLQPFKNEIACESNKFVEEKLIFLMNYQCEYIKEKIEIKKELKELKQRFNSLVGDIEVPHLQMKQLLDYYDIEVFQETLEEIEAIEQNHLTSNIQVEVPVEDGGAMNELRDQVKKADATLQSKVNEKLQLALNLNNFLRNELSMVQKGLAEQEDLKQQISNLNVTIENLQTEYSEFFHYYADNDLAKFFVYFKSLSDFNFLNVND